MAAVEYANKACGCIVRWVEEVLREFFTCRRLRMLREAAALRLTNALERLRTSEEVRVQTQGERSALLKELEAWRMRLAELKVKEAEAERARANLIKLDKIEKLHSSPGAPSSPLSSRPSSRAVLCGTNHGGLLGTKVLGNRMEAPRSLSLSTITAVDVLRRRASQQLDRAAHLDKPASLVSNTVGVAPWPPPRRRYLHVMSCPKLPREEVDGDSNSP